MLAFGLSGKLPNGIGRAQRGQYSWLHQVIQSVAERRSERLPWCLAANVEHGMFVFTITSVCFAAAAEPKLYWGLVDVWASWQHKYKS